MNLKKIFQIEYKLVLFILYIGFLLFIFISHKDWKFVLNTHVSFVVIFSFFYFGKQFIYILFAPLTAILILITSFRLKRYLKNFKQNESTHAAVILAHSDWYKLEAWIKPNFFLGEIKWLVKYLKRKGDDFSFFAKVTQDDVRLIMSDPLIKEVIFYGHGTSHMFQLCNDDILYYCEFSDGKYAKELVHQFHCGTKHGKSLIDYVVPDKNKSQCFIIRKSITSITIEKELKKMIKNF